MENHHQILQIRISLGFKFQPLIFFEQIFPKKEFFGSKIEKMNVTTESFILKLV